ncbi:DUF4112 domain-containing protein [Wenxinia saemankumensis]|uniref:DUF4112 domain-containing protein n=1 Tax=Wenxinia saemankumensis TaxID=1447782 RepID=A0A1M6H2T5_9RHOB|nr:DUF4112 domain-containing protein [Wenxinia saemankumensis]SHJ16452.1 protein of unknown function [Wenxinia saemankumensis]
MSAADEFSPRAARPAEGRHGPAASRPVDHAKELEKLDRMARLLDARYGVPGTRWRFGLDSVLGLIPGIGDAAAAAPSAWIIRKAHQLGVPGHVKARMVANTAIDTVVGSVPVLGNVFDFFYKDNLRNVNLLRDHLRAQAEKASPPV